jgi:hypothetical protein
MTYLSHQVRVVTDAFFIAAGLVAAIMSVKVMSINNH